MTTRAALCFQGRQKNTGDNHIHLIARGKSFVSAHKLKDSSACKIPGSHLPYTFLATPAVGKCRLVNLQLNPLFLTRGMYKGFKRDCGSGLPSAWLLQSDVVTIVGTVLGFEIPPSKSISYLSEWPLYSHCLKYCWLLLWSCRGLPASLRRACTCTSL